MQQAITSQLAANLEAVGEAKTAELDASSRPAVMILTFTANSPCEYG